MKRAEREFSGRSELRIAERVKGCDPGVGVVALEGSVSVSRCCCSAPLAPSVGALGGGGTVIP